MCTTVPIVIVGAGPTGLALARELALAGVQPVVIDKLEKPSSASKALGLSGRTLDLLERRGLLQRFVDATKTWPAFAPGVDMTRFIHFGGVHLTAARLAKAPPRVLNLFQAGAERCFEACAAELGISVCRGETIVGLEQTDEDVALTVSSRSGAVTQIRAHWVVGCDGAHSAVRKLAGIDFPGDEAQRLLRLADVALPPDFLAPGRWAGGKAPFIPLGNGFTRVVTNEPLPVDFPRDSAVTFDEIRESVRRVYGVDLPAVEVMFMSRFTDTSRLAESFRRGRVLLAGDAAHVHLPAGGPGINAGVNDAFNLGWKLAAMIAGTAPDGLLDSYHAERHAAGELLMMQTRAQGAMMHPTLESKALRDLVARLLEKEEALQEILDLLQGTAVRYDVGDDHALAGAWAPNWRLRLHDGASTALSSLMHDGRALLLHDGSSAELVRLAGGYARTLRALNALIEDESSVRAILIRPDGHVAWASSAPENATAVAGARRALGRWLTP